MKSTATILFSILLVFSSFLVKGQVDQDIINDGPQHPTLITTAIYMGEVPSIESQIANGTFKPAENEEKEFNPKRWGSNISVPGKGTPIGNDPLWEQQSRAPQFEGRAPILTFEAASSGSTPTDPTGAVGPNHFVNSWNSSFRIWDKVGNPLIAAASLGTILPGTAGDPIVIYDRYADRFLITEFYSNGFDVAISQGANPVTSGWFIYRFPTSSFPDYPKFSVWSDGYYITANKNSGTAGTSQVVFALERAKMLVGNATATMQGFPLTGIITSGFYSPLAFNANGTTPPPAGNVPVIYMQDNSWAGVTTDHIKLWSINVNWTVPGSSTISSPQIINTQPFDGLFDGGSFSNLPQPAGGADIDALQATIMYMAQYRRFPSFNSAVFNFVVDLNGADNYSGIRWFELRQTTDGTPWSIYQEGTYAAPGGQSAFCGNMCMDANGSIGLAYTIVNTSTFPSLRFTGRRASDPLGTMTLGEQVIATGTQIDPASRYGDYAQMTVDPNDDLTLWSIGEYFNGGRKNQVGVFKIGIAPVAQFTVSSTTPSVSQTVTFTDQSINTPTTWAWSFSPNTVTYVGGTSASSQNPQVQFAAVGLYTVTLVASNASGSDSEIKTSYINVVPYCIPAYSIGSIYGDYISLVQLGSINNATGAIPSPYYTHYNSLSTDLIQGIEYTITLSSGTLTSDNNISVWIDYNQNGIFDVTEKLGNVTVASAPTTGTITFTVPGTAPIGTTRMRVREVYYYSDFDPCSSQLYGETEDYNVNITPICIPAYSTGTVEGDYISLVQLGSINNATGASASPYYTYYSSLSTDLTRGTEYTITLSPGTFAVGNNISVWIDFDRNGIFDAIEKLGNVDVNAAPATGSILFTVPANAPIGATRMRVREVYGNIAIDPCSLQTYGETEDYNVNIIPASYCTPAYISGSGSGDYISLVQLGSINNATGASPSPFYTYYSSSSAILNAGSAYNVTLSPGTYGNGNNISVWIDYNYDGVFEETERIGNIDIPPTPATGTISFTVPVTALPGTTRMRVREVYLGGNMDPCATGYFGETEDYNVKIINSNKVLNLTVLLEGLYTGGGTMRQANNETGPQFGPGIADQITIEMHNPANYALIDHSVSNVDLQTNGFASTVIPAIYSGSYYLTIRHRNSIVTTSSAPVSFAGSAIFRNFNSPAKAFGGNLGMMIDGNYVIYGGDVNQDGSIDAGDMTPLDNDAFNYISGYLNTDINGDGTVDSGDMTSVDNNAGNYISTQHP